MISNDDRTPFFFSKWLTYSAACLVMLSAGLAYTFSIWSDAVKDEFGYSQTKLAGIGTAGNIGGYFAVFSGLFYDALKGWNRWAPSSGEVCWERGCRVISELGSALQVAAQQAASVCCAREKGPARGLGMK